MKINPTPVDILHRGDIFCFYREEQFSEKDSVAFYYVLDIDLFDDTLFAALIVRRYPISEQHIDYTAFKNSFISRYSLLDILEHKVYKVEPND